MRGGGTGDDNMAQAYCACLSPRPQKLQKHHNLTPAPPPTNGEFQGLIAEAQQLSVSPEAGAIQAQGQEQNLRLTKTIEVAAVPRQDAADQVQTLVERISKLEMQLMKETAARLENDNSIVARVSKLEASGRVSDGSEKEIAPDAKEGAPVAKQAADPESLASQSSVDAHDNIHDLLKYSETRLAQIDDRTVKLENTVEQDTAFRQRTDAALTELQEVVRKQSDDFQARLKQMDEVGIWIQQKSTDPAAQIDGAGVDLQGVDLDSPSKADPLTTLIGAAEREEKVPIKDAEKVLPKGEKLAAAISDATVKRVRHGYRVACVDFKFDYSDEAYSQAKKSSMMVHSHMYKFEESVWDIGYFPFVSILNMSSSLYVIAILITNILLQAFACAIIYDNFAVQEISEDTVNELRHWRTTVGHDSRWMDQVGMQSLARVVCERAEGVFMSSGVQNALVTVLNYQPNKAFTDDNQSFDFGEVGYLMCLLALLIWWHTCYIELRTTVDCFEAFLRLPVKSGRTDFIALETKKGRDDDIALKSMNPVRKFMVYILILSRAVICVCLCSAGTYFLRYTVELRELILNAAALEIILKLDELLYTSMVPLLVHHFVQSIEPIPKFSGRCFWRGHEFESLFTICLSLGLLFYLVPSLTKDGRILTDAREAVCGGYLDFVYTLDPGGAIAAHSTRAPIDSSPAANEMYIDGYVKDMEGTYKWKAVRELIENPGAVSMNVEGSLSDGAASLMGSRLGLLERPGIPVGERMSELNPNCVDVDTGGTVWPQSFVKTMMATESDPLVFEKCQDIADRCNWDNYVGISVRKWCPQTCGCNAANSSLILSRTDMGCPKVCFEGAAYQVTRSGDCEDHPSTSDAFMSYIQGLKSLRESYKKQINWYNMFTTWIDGLAAGGCNATKLFTAGGGSMGDLCAETVFKLKPLQNICPQTCGCDRDGIKVPVNQATLCPISCVASSSSTPLSR